MRILIVKTSALGDIVHCFHTIRYLKQCIPDAHISWVLEKPFSELGASHPDVDEVFIINSKYWRKNLFRKEAWKEVLHCRKSLRKQCFDLVLDLQGNIKSALVVSQVRSPRKVGFAVPYVAERPSILTTHERHLPPSGKNIREDYLYLAQQAIEGPDPSSVDLSSILLKITPQQASNNTLFLEKLPDPSAKKALVFPGAAWKNKQMNEADLIAFLRKVEAEYGITLLIGWGTAEEKIAADRIKSQLKHSFVIERLPLPQLQHLMAAMDLVFAMDSLPLHLAATAHVPTYSFFGPSEASKYGPNGKQHAFYQGKCPYGVTFTRRCPKLRTCSTGNCIRQVDVQEVFERFSEWWEAL